MAPLHHRTIPFSRWPIFQDAGALLHGGAARPQMRGSQIARLLLLLILCSLLYGLVMGTYTGFTSGKYLQLLYSSIKLPMLLMVTSALCLPSHFVVNALLGLRADYREAVTALLTTQAALTLILFSLAPLTAFWYLCDVDYSHAVLFNAAMFAVASVGAQFVLRREYAPLIARQPRHRLVVRAWIIIYAFVGIQMGYVLRPFIGNPDTPTTFLRENAWGNAYIVLIEIAKNAL